MRFYLIILISLSLPKASLLTRITYVNQTKPRLLSAYVFGRVLASIAAPSRVEDVSEQCKAFFTNASLYRQFLRRQDSAPYFSTAHDRLRMLKVYLLNMDSATNVCVETKRKNLCYLQVPKTGSTTIKKSTGLPAGTNDFAEIQRCHTTLVTVRDPWRRFVSGVGTIHHWLAREKQQPVCLPSGILGHDRELRSVLEFEIFAMALMNELSCRLESKSYTSFAGYTMISHILPQSYFFDLIPNSLPVCVVDITELASSGEIFDAEPHCRLQLHHSNIREGYATHQAIDTTTLSLSQFSSAFKKQYAALYADDYSGLGQSLRE